MLFPDSISTEDLSELLSIKAAPDLRHEQKERMVYEWAKGFEARKIEKEKKHKLSKHHRRNIYWWM
jgi:hypothetical protein